MRSLARLNPEANSFFPSCCPGYNNNFSLDAPIIPFTPLIVSVKKIDTLESSLNPCAKPFYVATNISLPSQAFNTKTNTSVNNDNFYITGVPGISSLNEEFSSSTSLNEHEENVLKILKSTRMKNVNRLIIAHININTLSNKFEFLKLLVQDNIDILVITETKLDNSFPSRQFTINGFNLPFRLDRNTDGGGVLVYLREDIPCRELPKSSHLFSIEGIFLEVKLRSTKWLLFGGYNNHKANIGIFLGNVGHMLDIYMSQYENFLLLGDFNSEMTETPMREFCDMHNLKNLITDPTCFKNPINPSCIDVILTNKNKSFCNNHVVETGLSDHHKMTLTVLKTSFQKKEPVSIKYRNYKKFDNTRFNAELNHILQDFDVKNTSYELFESTVVDLLNKHAPMKEKFVRANNGPYMNKILSKAFMTRSRLRNKFLKNPNDQYRNVYKKYRNYCVNLLRREKEKYYNSLDMKVILDNKLFWKTMKPFFSEKDNISKKITLIEGDDIITNNHEVAELLNSFFSNIVKNLDITDYCTDKYITTQDDKIINDVEKFKHHPSILKIKENNIIY